MADQDIQQAQFKVGLDADDTDDAVIDALFGERQSFDQQQNGDRPRQSLPKSPPNRERERPIELQSITYFTQHSDRLADRGNGGVGFESSRSVGDVTWIGGLV